MKITISLITESAIKIVEEHGYLNLTIKKLAQELQIKSPSLYNHIQNISDLQMLVIEKVLNNLKEDLQKVAIGRSNADALEGMALAYLDYARKHPNLYECIIYIPTVFKESLDEKAKHFLAIIYQVLDQFVESKELKILFVRGFRSLLHGFASLEAVGYFKKDINVDKSFEYTIHHFIADFFKRELNI